MTRPTVPLLLLLAACSPAAEQPAANQSEAAAAAGPNEAEAVPSLAGEWIVTSLNGKPLDQIFEMTATAAGNRLTLNSDCVALIWSYTQDRNVVAFTDHSTRECVRGRTANEVQVEKAIGAANIALFANEGAEVQLSGSGGTVTMTRRA